MKKLLFILLTTYLLMADSLPQTIQTTIRSVQNNGQVQLASRAPKGVSGIVIHNYGNGLKAITHKVVSLGNGLALATPYTATEHEKIPTIQTPIKVNDRVILGNFYNNVLVIAPNLKSYTQIINQFQRTWIHPDNYAVEFMKEGNPSISLESLKNFATINQVGLVLIATENRVLVLDPMSQSFIGSTPLQLRDRESMNPFFTRFKQKNTSTFSLSNISYTDYFQAVNGLK